MTIDIAKSGYGFILCIQGGADFDLHGERLRVQKGDLLILDAPLALNQLKGNHEFKFQLLTFPEDLSYHATRKISPVVVALDEADRRLVADIFQIVEHSSTASPESGYRKSFLQYQLLALLQIVHASEMENSLRHNLTTYKDCGVLVQKYFQLIERYFREHRFVDFYAQQLRVKPKYLSMLIHKKTGQDASKWIVHHVMLEAKALLALSDLPVKHIAEELHFVDISTFGKYFKRYSGMSPLEFRQHPRLHGKVPLDC